MEIASGQHLASGSTTKFQPLVILLFVFSVFLTACGGGASSDDSAPAAASASTGGSSGGSGSGSGDTTRPGVTINSPVTSASYTSLNGTISLGGVASDNVGVTQVTWSNSLGGSGTASGTGSWSVGSITLQNGTNTITVTARDAAGNTGTDTLNVAYSSGSGGSGGSGDTTLPTVTISSPTSSSSYAAPGNTIGLGGTASDNVGVTQVTWSNSLGGSGTASGTGSWSVGSITLQNGTNTITVTARDAAGNTGIDTLIVTYSSGSTSRTTYYLSPAGSDSNDGRSLSTPWKSFAKAFGGMSGGDELILLDGTYSAAAGTGYINYQGTGSAQPPSGTSLNNVTYVHALNPGNVTIQGGLFIGRSTRKDSFIKIQGITFEGGGSLYNTSYVTVKDCGFHGSFGIGTNDHDHGNDYDLIEDVWIWTSGSRIIAINYRSHHNVWRRVVVRGDGCGTSGCSGSGNPNVGITVYNSMDVSMQNVIVVDRILAATDEGYADFAVAQHAPGPDFGRAEWLGTMSLNSQDTGYYMEPDASVDPTIKISNAVAWDSGGAGFNLARSGTNNLLENLTVYSRGSDGIRVAPELTSGVLRNTISANAGRYGINSRYTPSYVNVFNARSSAYNQTSCSTGCYTSNPQADGATPSLKYLTRIEPGSFLKGKGNAGADIGANILYRYGADGARFGDAGYNTLTATGLWPWPNEDRIKRDMCANTTRGFCSTGQRLGNLGPVTLTTYVWEYLGNPIPSGIYP